MKVSFWKHKSKVPGKAQLYCRITMGGQRAEIGSTGITIWADHWEGQRISDRDPEAYFFLIHEKALDLLVEDFDITYVKKYRRWMKTLPQPDGNTGQKIPTWSNRPRPSIT